MAELKGSQTEQNLREAFAGESQARNKYNFFASAARKEGYEEIANIFEETAGNEKEHAKIWFKKLNGIGSTAANLKEAANGEHDEYADMYANFAKTAKAEGFDDLARLFTEVGKIEKLHHDRYMDLLNKVEKQAMFTSEKAVIWKCTNCGYETAPLTGAPKICPVCSHPESYFVIVK